MKKAEMLIFIFFILARLVSAELISGEVKDINEKFLSGIKVSVINDNKILNTTVTDRNGKFTLAVDIVRGKDYQISFVSSEFYKMKVNIKRDRRFYRIILIPLEHMKEEITVIAYNSEKHSSKTPLAESIITKLELKERMPESVVEALSETPGVDFLGKGGHSVTPSIRGLARRRVLMLLNGFRITSDRRVGTSASLVPPGLVRRVEIARAASSVIYGSDAMGGVVNLFTGYSRDSNPPLLKLYLNGHSSDSASEACAVIYKSFNSVSLQVGYSFIKAGNYSSPEGVIFNSGFKTSSGITSLSLHTEKRDLNITYFDGFGKNIGKPDRDNDPDNYTFNPLIRDRFIQFGFEEKKIGGKSGRLVLNGFFNPSEYDLTKVKHGGEKIEKSFTSSDNFGGKIFYSRKSGDKFSLSFGCDWYGRRSVNIENKVEKNSEILNTLPLSEGQRDDTGIFITSEFSPFDNFEITGGARYSFLKISALSSGEKRSLSNSSPVYYMGVKGSVAKGLSLFLNVSRSFRAPSLSESYYTGLTGRKYVEGNPDLSPERGISFDSGIKYSTGNFFLGAYIFKYSIKDLIERYRNNEGIYTYDNIVEGIIDGFEVEFQFFPKNKFELFGHFYYYRGLSESENVHLNDIPSPKLYLGSKFFLDRLWFEINYIHSFLNKYPGPAEVSNNRFDLLNLKSGFYFSPSLYLNLKISNLFNTLYFANADPDIPYAKGINFSVGITFNLR